MTVWPVTHCVRQIPSAKTTDRLPQNLLRRCLFHRARTRACPGNTANIRTLGLSHLNRPRIVSWPACRPRLFLTHVLPKGLHRIRHYGLFANGHRAANVARARELLAVPSRAKQPETSATAAADEPRVLPRPCRCCGGRMIIIETFARGCQPKHRPASATGAIEIDTS